MLDVEAKKEGEWENLPLGDTTTERDKFRVLVNGTEFLNCKRKIPFHVRLYPLSQGLNKTDIGMHGVVEGGIVDQIMDINDRIRDLGLFDFVICVISNIVLHFFYILNILVLVLNGFFDQIIKILINEIEIVLGLHFMVIKGYHHISLKSLNPREVPVFLFEDATL